MNQESVAIDTKDSYINKFLYYVKTLDMQDGVIELELKLLLDARIKTPNFIKSDLDLEHSLERSKSLFTYLVNSASPVISQTINFISTNTCNSESIIKQLWFEKGIQIKEKKQIYKKCKLTEPIYLCGNDILDNNFKLSVSNEITLNTQEDINKYDCINFDLIRYKYRYSFNIIPGWVIDFTLVKSSELKNFNDIKTIKDKFYTLKNYDILHEDNDWLWTWVDRIEIEFEYISAINTITCNDLTNVINFVRSIPSSDISNKKCIETNILNKLSTYISSNTKNNTKNNLYKINTLKKLLPAAIEINKKQYFEDILQNIDNFYITDKANGIRTILIITISSDTKENKNTINVIYYNSLEYEEYQISFMGNLDSNPELGETILECEKIIDVNGKSLFYVYDIISYDGKSICDKVFTDRLNFMYQLINLYPDISTDIKIKNFIKLDNVEYKYQIRNFHDHISSDEYKNLYYPVDGIIFTSSDANYNRTKYFKWKPIHEMSIDFIAKKCPSELLGVYPYLNKERMTLYILFLGISARDFNKMNMNKIQYYSKLFTNTDINYFPIQFSPSDNPYAYLFWYPSSSSLIIDNKVIELNYIKEQNNWNLLKIRDDRAIDVAKKNYYGNNFKTAEIIWRNYSNPLTLDILCQSYDELSKEFYFVKKRKEGHNAIGKFNNFVKFELLKRFMQYKKSIENSPKLSRVDRNPKNKAWLVDLGAGQGQDLHKYINMKMDNVLFIDVNDNNLCEIISRKYSSIEQSFKQKKYNGNSGSNIGIYIKKLNLNESANDNIKRIKLSGIPISKTSTKLIVCNFAIHYLIETPEKIDNLITLINGILAPGGRFIFTCLNGKKIFDELSTNALGVYKDWGDNIKYKIHAKFNGDKKFTGSTTSGGQKIDILLPFSDGKLYTENLVNLELLEKRFKKQKFKLESEGGFETYLDQFQLYNAEMYSKLDELDLAYIKFITFSIYYKP